MADRKGLNIIGYILDGVTAVVIGTGLFMVGGHLTGRYAFDDARAAASVSQPGVP